MLGVFRSTTFWRLFVGAVLTFILWYIQMWSNPEPLSQIPFPFQEGDKWASFYKDYLWPYKIQIGLVISVLLFFLQAFISYYPKQKRYEKWMRSMMTHVLNEKFKGDLEHTRITIFRVKWGYSFLLSYLWDSFVRNFSVNYHDNLMKCRLLLVPNPFKKYLVVFLRKSNPYENGKSTFFPIANSENEVCGIASHSLYIGKSYSVDVDNISDINLRKYSELQEMNNGTFKARVRKYMRENKIKDFNRLKCLHRLSNHVWANPIYDKNENPWGVVVVDNVSEEASLFATINDDLVSYSRIIQLSVIHLD